MIMKKIGLFFGGLSNEAAVSVKSAKNIAANIDRKKFSVSLVYWHKDGNFYILDDFDGIKKTGMAKRITPDQFKKSFEVALPITHGKFGEDGVLQGIFESVKLKYCGCRVLSSALCMDKSAFKTLMEGQGVKQTRFISFEFGKNDTIDGDKLFQTITSEFKAPFFVKPANSGSSIGISMVKTKNDLKPAFIAALKHDRKIIVEQGLIKPREIEVAVIGNGQELIISNPGELVPSEEFYSYEDKYKLNKTEVIIPAELAGNEKKSISALAKKAYISSGCSGFARIDFFISAGNVYLNEINTLPGFTSSSMFPLLMMEKGMTYKQLITEIINLAY